MVQYVSSENHTVFSVSLIWKIVIITERTYLRINVFKSCTDFFFEIVVASEIVCIQICVRVRCRSLYGCSYKVLVKVSFLILLL